MRSRLLAVMMAATGLALAPSAAHADALSGTLSITDFCSPSPCTSGVTVSLTTIDWFPTSAGSDGRIRVGSGTDDFAYLSGSFGAILDLNTTDQPVGAPFPLSGSNTNLVGEGIVLDNFMTFDLGGAFFDLSSISPGAFSAVDCAAAPASGQSCTPILPAGLSPFSLANSLIATPTGFVLGSTASFTVGGYVRNAAGELSTFSGIFTTQFLVPYQAYLPTLLAGGTVTNTYSATFEAVVIPLEEVPEPATLLTLGTGSLLLAARRRRKNAKVD